MQPDFLFQGLYSGWLWISLGSVLVAVVLIWTLYRYERKLVPRKVGAMLVTLRLLVLGVLLITLLEPVLSWERQEKRPGRIVVAIDLSESMTTKDTHAATAEKLQWARAVEMIGNNTVDSRLNRWIDDMQRGREPQWVADDETSDPERRKQLIAARQKSVAETNKQIDELTRKDIAMRLLLGTNNPLLEQLEQIADVEIVVFGGDTEPAEKETLEQIAANPPDSVLTTLTDVGQTLNAATSASNVARILGVVMITDGRDNSGGDPVLVATRFGQMSAPIYPLLMGADFRPNDISIGRLEYPETVFKDDKPILKVKLNTSGFHGKEVTVVLVPEDDTAEKLTRTVIPDGHEAEVEFKLDASKVGRHEYSVKAEAMEGETRPDNNEKSFAVSVVDDKVRVMLLEGAARWEFRFIDNALTRDERVDIQQIVFDQPFMGVLNDTFFARKLPLPADADDLENSPFAEPDMIVIGDVSPNDLSEKALQLLEKYVSESGGTLVCVAGKRHFPMSFQSNTLDQLLPVSGLKAVEITDASQTGPPQSRGFHLQLTQDGESESMFQFDLDTAENRSIWANLPGHMWGLLGTAKKGSTVFARAALPNPGEQPNLEAERRDGIIVHQYYGFGQVLWIGMDSTWRWRHLVGDQYHHRFWAQLARWAAENRVSAGNDMVKFGPARTDINEGEDARVITRWKRRFLHDNPNLKAKVEVYREGRRPDTKPFQTMDLKPVDGRPLIRDTTLVGLPAGQYRLKLVVEGGKLGDEAIEAPLYVHEKTSLELSDLSSNRELLTQIADASQGRLYLPHEAQKIPAMFIDPEDAAKLRDEIQLWGQPPYSWIILGCFFALLMSEWVIRKLNGLP